MKNLHLTYTYWQPHGPYGGYIRRSLSKYSHYYIGKLTPKGKYIFCWDLSNYYFSSSDEAKLQTDKIISINNIILLDEEQSQKYLILL